MTTIWIVPEFCPGPIYMGWHLYYRQPTKDRAGLDGHGWGWCKDHDLFDLSKLLRAPGHDAPALDGYKFKDWFQEHYPVGILLDLEEPKLWGWIRWGKGTNVREPAPNLAVPLAYYNARMFVRSAKSHGDAFVEGAPGHPRAKWTSHDWLCVLQDIQTAAWYRDLARALRSGGERPAPLPEPYDWMKQLGVDG